MNQPAPRVLLVEDDPVLGRIMMRTLPRHWTVVWARSLRDAAVLIEKDASVFDAWIVDCQLGDGWGPSFVDGIRKARGADAMPVVVFWSSIAPTDAGAPAFQKDASRSLAAWLEGRLGARR